MSVDLPLLRAPNRTDHYSCVCFGPALLAFEWVITLDREVRLVWGRKLTGASVLFVMNRYWLFFQYITQVITAYPMSQYVSPLSFPSRVLLLICRRTDRGAT